MYSFLNRLNALATFGVFGLLILTTLASLSDYMHEPKVRGPAARVMLPRATSGPCDLRGARRPSDTPPPHPSALRPRSSVRALRSPRSRSRCEVSTD